MRQRVVRPLLVSLLLFVAGCPINPQPVDGGDAINANAPHHVARGTVLFGGLFGLLVSAALFGHAAIRDVAAGMDPLRYTTRIRKAEYLGGRFLAALAMNAIVILAIPLGFWVCTVTLVEPDAVGPNRLAAYVQPLVLFLWPNIVPVGALMFTIGALVRQPAQLVEAAAHMQCQPALHDRPALATHPPVDREVAAQVREGRPRDGVGDAVVARSIRSSALA